MEQGSSETVDIYAICRELTRIKPLGADVSLGYAQMVIQHLFRNPKIDLCGIYHLSEFGFTSSSTTTNGEGVYNMVYELINARSVFFDVIMDSDPSIADELWVAILAQCDSSRENTAKSAESVLMHTLVSYVLRLLPCDDGADRVISSTYKMNQTTPNHRRIQTPLQLIRPSSPLLTNRSLRDKSQVLASSSLHPRHVTLFCNLLVKACGTETFATFNRLLILRYLVKQFFVFTLFKTTDNDINSLKTALAIEPPFSQHLYNFLLVSMEQCPSIQHFKELTSVWLTFARPWRYEDLKHGSLISPEVAFLPFAKANVGYYRVLLGKIIRKFMLFDTNIESIMVVKSICEFAWKEPNSVIVRKLGLDIISHVTPLLEQLNKLVLRKKAEIETTTAQNSSFFSFLTSSQPGSEKDRVLIDQISQLLNDSNKFIGTHFLQEELKDVSSVGSMTSSCILNETPKSGLLPDHIIEPRSNLMVLTPEGRKQVLTAERKFDLTIYSRVRPPAGASASEIASLVNPLEQLARRLATWPSVKSFADFYAEQSAAGWFVRQIMYPPVPNPLHPVPPGWQTVKQQPPLLKLRLFARYSVLLMLFLMLITLKVGFWVLIPLAVVYFLVLIVATVLQSDQMDG